VNPPTLLPRWHYKRSLAGRVILLTTFSVGVAMAFAALAVYVTVRMQMQETLDESLTERAQKAAASPALSDLAVSRPDIPAWALGAADVRIAFLYANGEVNPLADEGPQLVLGRPEYDVATGAASSNIRTIIAEDGVRYRVVTVQADQPGQALVIAQSLRPQERVLAKLGAVMLFFGVVGVIIAGAVGWAVARNGLRPVRRLTASVEDIARTEDLRPLRVEGDDEIARLAISFNHMLTALAASRDRQRQLVADAGHELRTPLTSLRTNIDLLTQADRGDLPDLEPRARAELLDDVRAQIEELTTLIGDLVELARDEPVTLVVEPVDLSEVVHRAVGRVRRRAPGVTFEVDVDAWWVVGEASSLERAVTNLLDNAAKWSPEGGTVRVRLADGALVVDDEGPGIAPEDRDHVFERFWRSDESRAMPGSGLGLAIVDQVVGRHAGTVVPSASPAGGTRMTVTIPGSVDAPVGVS
jgi:two-component system sensor histidine kinase MprB